MKYNTPLITISKIKFNNGTEIQLNKDDIVIFVGANNVGKSRTLKDIEENLIGNSENKVNNIIIDKIEYEEKNFTESSMKDYFERNFLKDLYSNYNIQTRYDSTYVFNDDSFKQIEMNSEIFYKTLFTFLSTESRLNFTSPILLNDINDKLKFNIMEKLECNEDKINKLNKYLINSFKKGIDINNENKGFAYSKVYKIGDIDEIKSTINSKRRDAYKSLNKMSSLDEQGDGIRSAVAILASLIVNEHSLFLIDEPEAFLHPPQARLLGNNIVELSKNKQCFLATHNIDLIRGILEKKTSRVKIIKINRENNSNTIFQLNNKDIEKISNDKNLKYTNILNGLFYSKVVLCENESDCKFYSAILESLDENIFQNTLFCAVGGKDQFKEIIPLLKSMKIDYIVIADIDLINDRNKLKQLLESIEKNTYDQIKNNHNRFLNEYEKNNISLVKKQVEIQKEINKLFTKDEYMSEETAKKIKSVLKNINTLKLLKVGGKAILPQGECISDFNEIEKLLNHNNIFILECGEIERFIPEIDLHGNAWVEAVFNKYKDMNHEIYDEAKKFIKKVFNITN